MPSMHDGSTVGNLADRQPVTVLQEVRGERVVVGQQTWPMAMQDWTNLWYRIDGGYVYSGFVFIPRDGEMETLGDRSGARSVAVDVLRQRASAMIGDRVVHLAAATTGKNGYSTPVGMHVIPAWGRKINETMTSAQAGIQDRSEQYNVQNVLFTQYFDDSGDALHLNYWQPESVFGNVPTSHGCVGLELHDAQYFWLFANVGTPVSIGPVPAIVPPAPAATATRIAPVLVPPLTPPVASIPAGTSTPHASAFDVRPSQP